MFCIINIEPAKKKESPKKTPTPKKKSTPKKSNKKAAAIESDEDDVVNIVEEASDEDPVSISNNFNLSFPP